MSEHLVTPSGSAAENLFIELFSDVLLQTETDAWAECGIVCC